MKTQETFQAWLTFAQETLRLTRLPHPERDYDAIYARDDEGGRLWDACLADGWTVEEAERAFGQEVGR